MYVHLFYSNAKFKKADAFIGFQKDTPASVVFQASNLFRSAVSAVRAGVNVAGKKWEQVLQWCEMESDSWNDEGDLSEDITTKAVSLIAFISTITMITCNRYAI